LDIRLRRRCQLYAAIARQAFERLYRTHSTRVFSLCARMSGSRTRGEELTQDVFVRTWEKLPQFRGESAFSTWLHRLAVNVVLNAEKFDQRVETICRKYYKSSSGRPSLTPGTYFRMLLLGYFEGIDSERGIAWRAADSLSYRKFLGYD